ncbi:carbohydrate ABC transporter permease [Microbispora sp. NEAU-D428]|uniref:carbohydrate ABC transporter permease n=1 Tax=Microbispora sitophila TaxID=2771537 RepID=UPI001867AE70|nr:carbohydrate ABC transporter permease [Microbispora sitophila]MBE3014034.1 carbohydrate ABC transporter permease [Microbispora sitophila]
MTGLRRGAGYLLVALAVVVFLYPIWWMVVSSLKPGASILNDPLGVGPFTLDNFRAMFGSVPIGQALGNTVLVVAIKGAITMILCPLAGYGFAKYSFRFKELLFGVVLLTLMLPTLTLVIPLLLEMKQLGWINTYQALILPGAVDAFSVFYMRQTISQVPDELLDAAAIDAAGTLRTFWSVVVPVIRPGLAALAVLTFFNIYNDLVWPIVAVNDPARQTVSVLLAGLATNVTGGSTSSGFDLWGQLMAACTIATIPTVIIFLLVQRHFIKGLLAGSVK